MAMKFSLAFMLALLTSNFAFAQPAPDQPGQGQSFSQFFHRITTAGAYPGIYVNAPADVQQKFLHWFPLGAWVGASDQARRAVQAQGVDVYLGWYLEPKPMPILFPGSSL